MLTFESSSVLGSAGITEKLVVSGRIVVSYIAADSV